MREVRAEDGNPLTRGRARLAKHSEWPVRAAGRAIWNPAIAFPLGHGIISQDVPVMGRAEMDSRCR